MMPPFLMEKSEFRAIKEIAFCPQFFYFSVHFFSREFMIGRNTFRRRTDDVFAVCPSTVDP